MASFKNNGKLKLLIIVGTRPEIIRLAAVITKCRQYFDTILAHTGQNYDYNLNGVFFHDLELEDPEVYLNAVGKDLGETMGNIIAKSYQLMVEVQPDAVLVLGDTNSCLSVIGAKRLHIGVDIQLVVRVGHFVAIEMAEDHTHSADGAADLTLPTKAAAEGGGRFGRHLRIQTGHITKCHRYRLGAVIALAEELCGIFAMIHKTHSFIM